MDRCSSLISDVAINRILALGVEIEYSLADEIFVLRLHHILLGFDVFLLGLYQVEDAGTAFLVANPLIISADTAGLASFGSRQLFLLGYRGIVIGGLDVLTQLQPGIFIGEFLFENIDGCPFDAIAREEAVEDGVGERQSDNLASVFVYLPNEVVIIGTMEEVVV